MIEHCSVTLLEGFEGWSAAILAIVGVGSLVATAFGVIQSRHDAKAARTFEYLRRLYGLEFASLNAKVLIFLKTGDADVLSGSSATPRQPSSDLTGEADREDAYGKLSLDWKTNVSLVLNFYEELSGSYRRGLLDRRVADNMLVPYAIAAWRCAEWIVKQERDAVDCRPDSSQVAEEIGSEWQKLVEEKGLGTSKPGPGGDSPDSGPRRPKPDLPAVLLLGFAVVAVAGLVSLVLGGNGVHYVAVGLLLGGAVGCLVLAALSLVPGSAQARLALLVSAALTVALSAGITTTVALTVKRGPPGHRGSPGEPGQEGEPGPPGKPGPRGKSGKQGERGKQGRRGPRGERGPKGERGRRGKRGPRGYPGSLYS